MRSKVFRNRNTFDLLFYHLKLRCYVVIELKACDFEPGFINQFNMYQNVLNDVMRPPDDKPTIGLLLVKGKNETVIEYSLARYCFDQLHNERRFHYGKQGRVVSILTWVTGRPSSRNCFTTKSVGSSD